MELSAMQFELWNHPKALHGPGPQCQPHPSRCVARRRGDELKPEYTNLAIGEDMLVDDLPDQQMILIRIA